MKARIYGNPYKELKQNRDKLTRSQYLTMKGQIANGYENDAMRGLERLLKNKEKL